MEQREQSKLICFADSQQSSRNSMKRKTSFPFVFRSLNCIFATEEEKKEK